MGRRRVPKRRAQAFIGCTYSDSESGSERIGAHLVKRKRASEESSLKLGDPLRKNAERSKFLERVVARF